MELPVSAERLAQLEDFGRSRGYDTVQALAEYLEWERQDYAEALDGIAQGLADVTAGRTRPAGEFLDEFARTHGIPP